MAEFCLRCWAMMSGNKLTEKDVVLSKEPDFCELCNMMRPVIVHYRKWYRIKVYLQNHIYPKK